MEKIIKNCRRVKKCNDGVDRLDKEDQRRDFRILLVLKKMKHTREKNIQL